MSHRMEIALVGNPNCGKTTVFNALTGAQQQVGNWPGVTVERVVGSYEYGGKSVQVTDLPGIYSFSALSPDEEVALRHILFDRPDVVVNVVDASNLERNLFLTTQLLEMDVPMVVALNMMDVARQRGIRIEVEHLAKHLGCPVVPVVASRKKGVDELLAAIDSVAGTHRVPTTRLDYGSREMGEVVQSLEKSLEAVAKERGVSARWLAVKLVEKDEMAREILGDGVERLPDLDEQLRRVERLAGTDADLIVADGRYGFIHGLVRDVTARSDQRRRDFSDAVDRVVLNRFLGFPVFFGIMYLVFAVTINVGGPFIDFFDKLSGTIFVDGFGHLLAALHTPAWLQAILADGIGGGIQTVSTFIPPIFFIFLCLSLLEDSGYMARAAFVMDHFLSAIGLPGKAFIPMLVGFGCNVPGIMATRTLESHRDRVLAILINPFMSCGARLPVYTLFAAAFFPQKGGLVIFGLYLIGILLAVASGLLFKSTILAGEATSFVMELPPYHLPTLGGVLFHTWNRLKSFILKAGQVILVIVTILGFLNSLGTDGSFGNNDSGNSVLSAVGRTATPVFQPMGIERDNWPATVGIFTGILAKESVVGTLSSIYSQMGGAGEVPAEAAPFDFWQGVRDAFAAIPAGFDGFFDRLKDPLGLSGAISRADHSDPASYSVMVAHFGKEGGKAAFAYLLFILIYSPCVAALAAIMREIGTRWMLFSFAYLTGLAWVVATFFFQVATFAEHPAASAGWIGFCLLAVAATVFAFRKVGKGKEA